LLANAFVGDWVWIDALIAVILGGMHALAWPMGGYAEEPTPRKDAGDAMARTATAGTTAVGIMIPATLVVAKIGQPAPPVLGDIFFADVWFTVSLAFGLYVLWSVGVRASTGNVLNRRDVGWVYGWQLILVLIGVARLMVGLARVFGGQ